MSDVLPRGPYITEPIGHVEAHLRWCRRAGMVDDTLRRRSRALTLLAEYLGHDPVTATVDELEEWQDHLQLTSDMHVRHQTHLIRPYYRWLHQRGHRGDDPAAMLVTPRRSRRIPRPITDDALLQAVETAGPRELPWLLLAGWCGLRAAEITGLRREHVLVDARGQRWLHVTGKNGAERDVPVPGWVWRIVDPAAAHQGWMWRRQRGPGKRTDPPTPQHVSQYCNEHLRRAGLGYTLHSLRARTASLVLDDTANLRLVQALLGHAHLSTVQDYTLVRPQDVATALDRLPRPVGHDDPAPPPRAVLRGQRPDPQRAAVRDGWIDDWLAAQRSTATRDGYRREINQFVTWCDDRGIDLVAVHRRTLDDYRDWLAVTIHRPRGGRSHVRYGPRTITRKLGAIASLYSYLVDEQLVAANPAVRVARPRVAAESSTRALSVDQSRRLLDVAALVGPGEAAAVGLMLVALLRAAEVRSLDIDDLAVDSGRRVLDVTRKGGRRQRIAIPDELAALLDAAISARPSTVSRSLLLGPDGLRLHRHRLGEVLHLLADRAGLREDGVVVTPHVLRHTGATRAFDAGVETRYVQELMGHRWPSTTEYYDRARLRVDRGAAAALGPVFLPAR